MPVPAGGVVREASTSAEPLSVDRLLGLVRDPRVGGIGLFIGVVRDHDHGAAVTSLDYTAHPTAAAALTAAAAPASTTPDLGTRTLVFDCASLLAYISTFTVLRPGDVVLTGTPGGVGMGMTPPTFLADGDVVETEIPGIGTLTNTVRLTA